jgi:hypothetical protein
MSPHSTANAQPRLRLTREDALSHPENASRWHPTNNWRPGRRHDGVDKVDNADSIANAESALEHAERSMRNLRALLGEPAPTIPDGPRAA